jgi:tetratricopeptide (TPR) repeat protein
MYRRFIIASLVCAVLLVGWSRACLPSVDARRRSALAALEARDLERMQYELLDLSAAQELQPYASLLKGSLLLSTKRFAEALEELEVATAREETRARGMVLMGQALYRMRRIAEAGETWMRVLETAPDDLDAKRWLGVAYYDLCAAAEAFYYLDEAARLAPGDGRPHRMMALLCGKLGDWRQAAEYYEESLLREPSQPDVDLIRLDLAEALHLMGHSKEALAALQPCPKSADVLQLRAACVYHQGDVDEAWELLDEALLLDADHVKSLALRGRILLLRKQPQEAAESLKRAERLAPRDLEVLTNLLGAYQRLGDPRVETVKQALLETRELRQTYSELVLVAARDPRDAAGRAKLGALAERLKEIDVAKSWYRAALSLEPGNQAVASALLRLGATDEDIGAMRYAARDP